MAKRTTSEPPRRRGVQERLPGGVPEQAGAKNAKKRKSTETAARYLPERRTGEALRAAAAGCQACDLWKTGTQTVFGEGSPRARIMFVGEQPGNQEDLAGKPFVGPAGRLLDEGLAAAGIDRGDAYVTNVVKHFKWEPRGKIRLHKKPNAREISACKPWLEAEIELVRPRVLVALGATAAQALFGPSFRVSRERGRVVAPPSPGTGMGQSYLVPYLTATVHPSSILRQSTDEEREAAMAAFIADLRQVRRVLDRA